MGSVNRPRHSPESAVRRLLDVHSTHRAARWWEATLVARSDLALRLRRTGPQPVGLSRPRGHLVGSSRPSRRPRPRNEPNGNRPTSPWVRTVPLRPPRPPHRRGARHTRPPASAAPPPRRAPPAP